MLKRHAEHYLTSWYRSRRRGSLKSLQQFVFRKGVASAVRFDLNPPSVQTVRHVIRNREGNRTVEYVLMSLPLYLVEELPRILDGYRRPE